MIVCLPLEARQYPPKLQEKRKQEQLNAILENIPVYRDRIRTAQILGAVRGQDAFTNKNYAIVHQMREQAHKLGANAIMEFSCDKSKKIMIQTCTGFAIFLSE